MSTQFWTAVDTGEAVPFALVEQLLAAGLPLSELAGLSQADAERRLEEWERRE